MKTTAERNNGLFVDEFHPYLAVLDKARAAASAYERITGGDAVHPGPPGQALMAWAILKGMGFPREVSSVEITLRPEAEPTTQTSRCKVGDRAACEPRQYQRQWPGPEPAKPNRIIIEPGERARIRGFAHMGD